MEKDNLGRVAIVSKPNTIFKNAPLFSYPTKIY